MPGMGQAPQTDDPTVVSAFHSALAHQGLLILCLLALLAISWNVVRTVQFRRVQRNAGSAPDQELRFPEPLPRRVLRIGFGILWVVDGLLQLQQAMPLGMPTQVLQPSETGARPWVQSVMNVGLGIWEKHPVEAAAAAVWIQLGIGVLLLVSSSGRWARIAGLASVGWGLVVWVFGEAFGGIFTPGLTWLFGAPGSVLLYVIAGALVALPDRAWMNRELGRRILVGSGSFFVVMAVLQAWPGRGFWQGRTATGSGTLPQMLSQMAATPQPQVVRSAVSAFESFDLSHGWAVNLFVVISLAVSGVLLCSGKINLLKAGAVAAGVLGLADWLLVQDLGVFGGTGTDPNSALPMLLIIITGYLVFAHEPALATSPERGFTEVSIPAIGPEYAGSPWWTRVSGRQLRRGLVAIAAVGVVLVGAVPMAFASFNQNGDAIVSEATDGTPVVIDSPAPKFDLRDQAGLPVSLDDLKGKVVALTFLDPVCTSDCPTIAQEFRETDSLLGPDRSKVALVAIATNQLYTSVATLDAFDRQEGLNVVPNWLFLTGTASQLQGVWNDYGVQEQVEPAGAMVAHTDVVYVIDATGAERAIISADPTPGSAGETSFSQILLSEIRQVLPR
jgi:cytochrome oxidase Cu insertion factor (SCO1/SenC/PrrC family)